jgi:hypothetical protein
VLISEKLFIGGDLNGHVGSTRVGFDGVHGGFGYGSRNQEGEGILNFGLAYDLFVANTLFKKRVSHLITFSSGQHCSQINFILARREDMHAFLDCKVIPGECVVPQHKLVVADFCFRVLGTELSLSSRGRMTLGVEAIFWFISHTLSQCHTLQGVGDTYL